MKKGIAITLALVMMVLFVGCGLANQLVGTAWEYRIFDGGVETVETLEFKEDNVLTVTITGYYEGVEMLSYSANGTWSVFGNELTMEYTIMGETVSGYTIAEVKGDEWILTDPDNSSSSITFKRVK